MTDKERIQRLKEALITVLEIAEMRNLDGFLWIEEILEAVNKP